MPLYEYKAYNRQGKGIDGIIDAPSRKSAYDKLKKQGCFPYEVAEDKGSHIVARTFSVSRDNLAFSLTQLATLLSAGMTLTAAIDSLVMQVEDKGLSRAFARLRSHIAEGKSLAKAMEGDKIFPPLLVRMIESGESVGNLELILERYADFLEKESGAVKKIIGALVYPAVIMTASFGLIFFILTYVAPTLVEVFEGFGKKLPFITAVIIALGTFLKKYIILIAILLVGAVFIYLRYIPRRIKDTIKARLPLVGRAYRYLVLSRWARTLGMLHGGGVTLLKALETARGVVDNVVFEEELKTVEKSVEKGQSLSLALSRLTFFPPLLIQMVETGQQSGELEKMMNVVANFYEKEMDRRLSVFFQLLEPLLILVLGVVVGFVVVSILLPIFEINRLVR
ncbi:MAG: type II secretion system F family protein [Candidatus Xenobiia bacterium LiM19]